MTDSQNFPELLRYYLTRRLGEEGTTVELAKAVNERFGLDEGEGLKRQTINNWLKESKPRDWWQLAAITCILCETEEEADELLQAAGLDVVDSKRSELEEQILMDEITRKKVEALVVRHWNEKSEREAPKLPSQAPFSTLRLGKREIIFAAIGTAVLIALLGYIWRPTSVADRPDAFEDDFSNLSRCETNWDFVGSQYAQCNPEEGILQFDIPAGSTSEGWMSDVVDSTLTGGYLLSQINFTAALDSLSTAEALGNIGIQTDCHGNGTWLVVYIGGPRQALYAEYGKNDSEEIDGMIPFDAVLIGQEHDVMLEWLPGGVKVTLDGKVQSRTIPCSQTEWLQLIAGGEPNKHIKGYISQIQVWAK